MQPKPKRGGKRKGAGRKAGPVTVTHSVRTTKEGWKWLKEQALAAGFKSIGMWARSSSSLESRAKAIANAYYWYDRMHFHEMFDKDGRRLEVAPLDKAERQP